VPTAGSCPVPAICRPSLGPCCPARRHVARVSRRYHTGIDNLWDETVTALLRASVHYDPAMGAFAGYAHTAIHRACWRYVCRRIASRGQPLMLAIAASSTDDAGDDTVAARRGDRDDRHGTHADEIDLDLERAWPSAEDEILAREAVRRAWLLREHAAIADARRDIDTTTRLLDAATAAATVARATRRRPRITPTART
jgi:hypothetical protein